MMKRQEIQENVGKIMDEYNKRLDELSERYEAKWYLAETAKEHLAINEWHDKETAKLTTWYANKLGYWLSQPIEA